MRDERERLHDILEAISQIERYASQGKQAFETDELIQMTLCKLMQKFLGR